ncbi:MAG: PilZ domain-containing protein [Planctomycetota bacterium]
MTKTTGLTIRQHERSSIALDAEFVVSARDSAQVRFSPSSSARDKSTVRGIATDISPGGMGLNFGQFLPRGCTGTVRIYRSPATGDETTTWRDVMFEHSVTVRRIYLDSHDPTYRIGVSFADPEPALGEKVAEIITIMNAMAEGNGGDHA